MSLPPPDQVVAVIPAAGTGSRLGDSVSGSKEVAEVGGQPVIAYLLRRLRLAGIDQAVVVLREGKSDVQETLSGRDDIGVDLSYLIVEETPSELHSVAAALQPVDGHQVALGDPDILFQPRDAFAALLARQHATGADLVLGLFTTDHPERVDMVALDDRGRPVDIVIKQPDRGLDYSWCMAVWAPRFGEHLTDFVASVQLDREPSVGDVVQAGIENGLNIEGVIFGEGHYLDVGTPEDLATAWTMKWPRAEARGH